MRAFRWLLSAAALISCANAKEKDVPASLHDITATSLAGKPEALSQYKGKVVLIVNTASECGFTPQYAGLQKLYEQYRDRGFVVLGFPSNEFAGQEPGSSDQIATFCKKNYGVEFPMFEKVATKGKDQSPVFAFVAQKRGTPKWNFYKYLVGKTGQVKDSWSSFTKPEAGDLKKAIEAALAE